MTEPTTKTTEASQQETIVFLPGHAFFIDIVEAPESLESSELENFAELSLESLSPFPVDQLCWGFIFEKNAGKVLIYATHRERLERLGYKDLESALWVFPDFVAPIALPRTNDETKVLLEGVDGCTLFEYGNAPDFPSAIYPRKSLEAIPEQAASERRRIVRIDSVGTNDKDLPILRLNEDNAPEESKPQALRLDPAQLWNADVRPLIFKKEEQNRRRMSSIIGRLTAYAAVAALLILLLELVLMGGGAWSSSRENVVAQQLPEVRRIEDKQSLINKLDQVAQSELRPIAMLEALNETRPAGIYFTNTVTEGRNRITIDGIASTINELNAYTDSLRNSGKFELTQDPEQITKGGRTSFTVTLDYFHSGTDEGGLGG